ncbi:MAG: hypothetical protein ACM3ZC_16265, partial [Bacteroidota bacterium]
VESSISYAATIRGLFMVILPLILIIFGFLLIGSGRCSQQTDVLEVSGRAVGMKPLREAEGVNLNWVWNGGGFELCTKDETFALLRLSSYPALASSAEGTWEVSGGGFCSYKCVVRTVDGQKEIAWFMIPWLFNRRTIHFSNGRKYIWVRRFLVLSGSKYKITTTNRITLLRVNSRSVSITPAGRDVPELTLLAIIGAYCDEDSSGD